MPRRRLGSARVLAATVLVVSGCAGTTGGPTTTAMTGPTTTTAPAMPGKSAPPTTTASESGRQVETVLALVGSVLVDDSPADFVVSVDGDWLVRVAAGASWAFDARKRTLFAVDGEEHTLHVGLAPSGPDSPYLVLERFLPISLGARGLEAVGAGFAREGWWFGGAAIDFADHFRRPGLEDGAFGDETTDHVWVSLDAETLLPVYVVHAADQRPRGVSVRRWEVVSLETTSVDRAEFDAPDDTDGVTVIEHGFTIADDGALSRLGYPPPRPGWLPDGYEEAGLVVADAPLLWWSYPSNPPSESVSVLTYRRGVLETLTITARTAATGDWSDPYHRGDTASNGFLYDAPIGTFRVVSGPWPFWPVTHAWGTIGDLVVSVGGHVSVADLLRVLDALEL